MNYCDLHKSLELAEPRWMLLFEVIVLSCHQVTCWIASLTVEPAELLLEIVLVDGCFVAHSLAKLSKVFLSVIEKPLDTGSNGNSGSEPGTGSSNSWAER